MGDGLVIVLCTLIGSLTTAVLFSVLHGFGWATAIGFAVGSVLVLSPSLIVWWLDVP